MFNNFSILYKEVEIFTGYSVMYKNVVILNVIEFELGFDWILCLYYML